MIAVGRALEASFPPGLQSVCRGGRWLPVSVERKPNRNQIALFSLVSNFDKGGGVRCTVDMT